MVAKRALDFSKVTDMSVSKRLKKVERQVRLNRPEMKSITFSASGNVPAQVSGPPVVNGILQTLATNISQGDAVNQRLGDKVRVWRIEVRGAQRTGLDTYILQNHGNNSFSGQSTGQYLGAFLLDSISNNVFTEWQHIQIPNEDDGSFGRFKRVQKFRNGMIVRYSGSVATPVDNGLIVATVNTTNTALAATYSMRVWFTDA